MILHCAIRLCCQAKTARDFFFWRCAWLGMFSLKKRRWRTRRTWYHKILMMKGKDRKCYLYLKLHINPPYIVYIINCILTHTFTEPSATGIFSSCDTDRSPRQTGRPIQSPLTTRKGVLRTYFTPTSLRGIFVNKPSYIDNKPTATPSGEVMKIDTRKA